MFKIATTLSKTLSSRAQEFKRELAQRVEIGLVGMGEHLLAKSQPLVPRDTLTLEDDGHVRTEGSGFGMIVVVGYGYYDTEYTGYSDRERGYVTRRPHEYAVRQHYEDGWFHLYGQSNYLGEPLETERAAMLAIFLAAVVR